jgi:Lon protease-like protein
VGKLSKNIIPMFPLNTAVLPGEDLALFIFEPRYKQLLKEVQLTNIVFGIPFVKYGRTTKYGTFVMLKRILNESENGEMNIIVEGLSVFKIEEYLNECPDKLYPGATVREDFPLFNNVSSSLLQKTTDNFRNYASKIVLSDIMYDIDNLTFNHSYDIAKRLELSADQKFALISFPSELQRLQYLNEFMTLNLEIISREAELKNRFILN